MGIPARVVARNLKPTESQVTGCDSVIVIRIGPLAKVGLFEAKYPRISEDSYEWDRLQESSGISHFSDQILRQTKWLRDASIWEMFIVEYPVGDQPKSYDARGCTCIWHTVAHFLLTESLSTDQMWSKGLVELLVSLQDLFLVTATDDPTDKNLGDAIHRTLFSFPGPFLIEGKPLFGSVPLIVVDDAVTLRSTDKKTIKIPCSTTTSDDAILEHLAETGITNYLLLDTTDLVG